MTSNLGVAERAADRVRRHSRPDPRRRRARGARVLPARAVQPHRSGGAVRAADARGRGAGRRQGARQAARATRAARAQHVRLRGRGDPPPRGRRRVRSALRRAHGQALARGQDRRSAHRPARERAAGKAAHRAARRGRRAGSRPRSSRWLERPPVPGPYLLEGALDLATAGARADDRRGRGRPLARVRDSQELSLARAEATGELRYYVDELDPAPGRARAAVRGRARTRRRARRGRSRLDDEAPALRHRRRAARRPRRARRRVARRCSPASPRRC